MKPDLETRIADAFGAALSSKQLNELLIDVAQADSEAKLISVRANEAALDPATRPGDVVAARREAEDADFRRLRMERAKIKLAELRDAAVQREQAARQAEEHAVAICERDQLVADLAAYEQHAKAIAALLVRLEANNRKLHMDEHAECIARGVDSNWKVQNDDALPKLLERVRLPTFRKDGSNYGYLWPKQ